MTDPEQIRQHSDLRRALRRLTENRQPWPAWILGTDVESAVDYAIEQWGRKNPDPLVWIIRAGVALNESQRESVAQIAEGKLDSHGRHENAQKINQVEIEFLAFWFQRYDAERDDYLTHSQRRAAKAGLEVTEYRSSVEDRCRARKEELANKFGITFRTARDKILKLRKAGPIFPMPELPDEPQT